MPYTYDHPRPMLTVDCVVLRFDGKALQTLLIRRKHPPFKGKWALPGGFVEMDEDLAEAARRELAEETNIRGVHVEAFGAFGKPGRDPRGRVVSVAHLALARPNQIGTTAGDDAEDARWFPVEARVPLAFDHKRILEEALRRLRELRRLNSIVPALLPRQFTLPDLQALHEAIEGGAVDKRNFRRQLLSSGVVKPLEITGASIAGHPAALYEVNPGGRAR